jgi:preprotein translocase subunit SecE
LAEQRSPKPQAGSSSLSTRAKTVKLMQNVKVYFMESWEELRNKVSWSSFKELQSSAILVLVASTIFALIIGAIDWTFKTGLEWFYREF